MKEIISKNLSQFILVKNAKKIRGKKAPIIIKTDLYEIKHIYQYKIEKEFCGVGFEYLIIICSNKKEGIQLLFGKIIARSSSDFLSMLAGKLISKIPSEKPIKRLDLIQYPLIKKDPSRRLIVLMKISDLIRNADDINALEDILLQCHKKFRKAMSDIISNTLVD